MHVNLLHSAIFSSNSHAYTQHNTREGKVVDTRDHIYKIYIHIQICTHDTSTFMQYNEIYMQIDDNLETYLRETNEMRGNKRLIGGVTNEMKVDY